jgi:nucleoside-diphosphate kinase
MGRIITKFEDVGLKIVALKLVIPTEQQVKEQYGPNKKEIEAVGQRSIEAQLKQGVKIQETAYERGNTIVNNLIKYLTSGPVVTMVIQGNHAIDIVSKLIGSTQPLLSDVGTIRGDYTIDSYDIADADGRAVRNIIHRSATIEEAKREIKIWFKDEEILKYRLVQEVILYDVNLDYIME